MVVWGFCFPRFLGAQPDLAFLPDRCGYQLLNDTLTLFLTWENQGNEPTRSPYSITIALANYEKPQIYYLELNRSIASLGLPSSLAPGERITLTRSYDLAQFNVEAGKLDIVVQLDPQNQIREVAEQANNVWSLTDWIPYKPQWPFRRESRSRWIQIHDVQLQPPFLTVQLTCLHPYPVSLRLYSRDGTLFFQQTFVPLWSQSLFFLIPLPKHQDCFSLLLTSENELLYRHFFCRPQILFRGNAKTSLSASGH
jgi:hypothetical protein